MIFVVNCILFTFCHLILYVLSSETDIGGNLDEMVVKLSPKLIGMSQSPAVSTRAQQLYEAAHSHLKKEHPSKQDFYTGISFLENASAAGHSLAALEAIELLFLGNEFIEPDYERCVKLFSFCKEARCHFYIGLFYHQQLGEIQNKTSKDAASHFVVGAFRKDTYCAMALGYMFAFGRVFKRNCTRAVDEYMKVVDEFYNILEKHRSLDPSRQLKLSKEKNELKTSQDVIEFYRFSADSGDVSALTLLGQVYYSGIGHVPRDISLARYYFERAAKLGDKNAIAHLGILDFFGDGIDGPDYESALEKFKETESVPIADYGLGLMYKDGIIVDRDEEKALSYLKSAANNLIADAHYQVGKLLQRIDIELHNEAIFTHFLLGTKEGSLKANYELIMMHIRDPDNCELNKHMIIAFLAKHPILKLNEEGVKMYRQGKTKQAISRFMVLALQGFEVALHNIAFSFHEQAQLHKDSQIYSRAFTWWKEAAASGNVEALLKAGDYLYYGLGIESNAKLATVYYFQAMDKSDPQAAYNLGYMYAHGVGIPKDRVMAMKCFEFAKEYGRKAEMPEVWLPISIAVNYLRILDLYENIIDIYRKVIRHSVLVSPWIIKSVSALIVGIITLIYAMKHFKRRQNTYRTILTQSNAPTPCIQVDEYREQEEQYEHYEETDNEVYHSLQDIPEIQ